MEQQNGCALCDSPEARSSIYDLVADHLNWLSDWSGSALCRTHLWSIDEPCAIVRTGIVPLHFADLWIYLVAPILGALLAVPTCRCTQAEGCCTSAQNESAL
jgi:hypothetical protein